MSDRGVRLVLGLAGLAAGAYGAFLLLDLGWDNLLATGTWLVGGVVLHDGVLAPVVVLVCAVGTALSPPAFRAPLAAGFVVLATVTLSAVPVLGRFGARADNATLLDRDYGVGWLLLAAAVLAGVVIGGVIASARPSGVRREAPAAVPPEDRRQPGR